MKKRLLSTILALAMILTIIPIVPIVSSAANEPTETRSAAEGEATTDSESAAVTRAATAYTVGYDDRTLGLMRLARAKLAYLDTQTTRSEVDDALARLNGIAIGSATLSCTHSWAKTGAEAATCISKGYDIQTCSKCGMERYVANGTTKLGHTSMSNCTRCGRKNLVVAGKYLLSCDRVLKEGIDYEATESSWNSTLKLYCSDNVTISNVDADVPIENSVNSFISLKGPEKGKTTQEITLAGLSLFTPPSFSMNKSPISVDKDLTSATIHVQAGTTNYLFSTNEGVNKYIASAIYKGSGSTQLTIDGSGLLFAIGYVSSGIGGQSGSNITIRNATVIAGCTSTVNGNGVGIGADNADVNGITIEDASVIAFGGYFNIIDQSSTSSSSGQPGIGVRGSVAENIKITQKSVVIAQGYGSAPGIGTTLNKADRITIERESVVTAFGGEMGAGIGSITWGRSDSNRGTVSNITIEDSVVRAFGSHDMPGIGVNDSSVSGITIKNSAVTAVGGTVGNVPGIGVSYTGNNFYKLNLTDVVIDNS